MNNSVIDIPLQNLILLLALMVPVLWFQWHWGVAWKKSAYAIFRMLLQLLAVGYVLAFMFAAQNAAVVLSVLLLMLLAASWISLNPLKSPARPLYLVAFVSILLSGGVVLLVVTQGVLQVSPWYAPQTLVPLAGMIFSGAMTSVSLSAERIIAEMQTGASFSNARKIAFSAALIPPVNALFAVGLVALPGMMTGQILAGVSPLIATKYQIMVMLMMFASANLSATVFLMFGQKHLERMLKSPTQKTDL